MKMSDVSKMSLLNKSLTIVKKGLHCGRIETLESHVESHIVRLWSVDKKERAFHGNMT